MASKLYTWLMVLFLVVLLGIVGEMDYQDNLKLQEHIDYLHKHKSIGDKE